MSKVLEEVLAENERYASTFGDKEKLPMPPARQFAILTCMDARLDPAKFAGLSEGDAHVIRNAGGRANDDAIQSLMLSHKLLGTREWFVIHHTNCGAIEGPIASQVESVHSDVQRLRTHPLVPRDITIYGFIYDVKTGRLVEVPQATKIGKAS